MSGAGQAGVGDFGNGSQAGVAGAMQTVVDPGLGGAGGMGPVSNIEPISIDNCAAGNPAGLSDTDVQALQAGGPTTGGRMLYPYDQTVFPRGMLAPTLMWEGGMADAVYVHIQASLFEYKGCLTPTGPNQLTLPQDVWDMAGQKTRGPSDPFVIEVTTRAAGAIAGPFTQHMTIAQATIKGSIFYNSYSSLLPSAGGLGGAVLRIPPGGVAEKYLSVQCNGCHTLSANGSRMVTQTLDFLNPALTMGKTFPLTPTTPKDPPGMTVSPRGAWSALTPDGSVYLTNSTATSVGRSVIAQGPGASVDAQMFETDTGVLVANTGIPVGAMMPMFSPDGGFLVFNDFAIGSAKGLALMRYDGGSRTAADYRVLYTEPAANMRPGWPFFLPDNGGVVFTRTNALDFSGDGAGLLGITFGPASDLHMVDVDTGTTLLLARAMGFNTVADAASDSNTYLPFGAEDLHKNYFPTVSPVAAGGYFWVLFDSLRHYGNRGITRQLWGAAVAITADGDYTIDRSHPPFYLEGQEFGTGNHRAFAALDPCKMDGNDCTSGIDCCGGFCTIPDTGDDEFGIEPVGKCTANVPMCAKTNERCTTNADCCPPEDVRETPNTCIAGFCAVIRRPD